MKGFEQLEESVLYLKARVFFFNGCRLFFLFELNVFLCEQVKSFCLLAFS